MHSASIFGVILFLALCAVGRTALPSACVTCQKSHTCLPPDCYCCSDDLTLSNVSLTQIPQMVFFTFDDAVTGQASGFYKQLFDSSRKNPNGCPITMTLFISHDNTQYGLVSEFHGLGMEIAAHSVTHSTMNGSNFLEEAKAQKENLAKLAGIPIEAITGWRSPFLKPTGDLQPDTLKKLGYTYDATLTFSKRSFREKPPGPFTLDYGYPYECQVKPCPMSKHPGFWEIPVVSLMDYKQAYDCVYVDGCMNAPPDEDTAYKFLWDNFYNYYTTTKMPFGINMHSSWFYYPDRLKAMDRFIQKLVSLNDVYIVSVSKMIEWLKRPTPLQDLHAFAPWACDGRERAFNTGPRLVQTIGAPAPIPRSFIQWSSSPTIVYAPTPSTGDQRTFTQTRQFTPPGDAQLRSQSRQIFTLDLPQEHSNIFSDLGRSRRQQAQLRQTARPTFASRVSDPMFHTGRPDVGERLHPPTIRSSFSQQFLLEQHEERKRQKRILEEQLRHQQLEIQRQREADMQNQMEIERLRRLEFERQQQIAAEHQRQLEFERQLQIEAERQRQQDEDRRRALQQQLDAERQAVQQRLQQERQQQQQEQQLYRRHELLLQQRQQELSIADQPMNSPPDAIKNSPTEVQIKNHILWKPVIPSSIPDEVISRVENRRQWVPQNVQQETINVWPQNAPNVQSQEISNNPSHDTTLQNSQSAGNLLQLIETPSKVGQINITPAPPRVPSLITLRFSESPHHIWFTNLHASRGPSNNAPRSGRGGSNRRPGDQRQHTFPAQLQDQRLRQSMVPNANIHNRQLNGMSPHVSNMGSPHMRTGTQGIGRHIAHPNIAQQIAWNNFIRQMLGPH